MDVIQFLERTNGRNFKFNMDFLFKQRMQALDEELASRRKKLQSILEYENLRYDEELALLMRERVEEAARKRLEWIGTKRIEREKAEEELLEWKKIQRELENCEEMRHLQSKQILMETKRAQLYQIEEKNAIRQREEHVEQLWLAAIGRLNEEKEKQEIYARKLCKVIAHANQAHNEVQDKQSKLKTESETAAWRHHHAEEDARANSLDKKYREAQMIAQQRRKIQQNINLTNQIRENASQQALQQTQELATDKHNRQIQEMQIQGDLERQLVEKIRNREWHKSYLEYMTSEKQLLTASAKEMDGMLLGRGCVLQQENKRPYGRNVR